MAAANQDNGLLNSISHREKDMKKKLPLDQEVYLPEYFSVTVTRSFEKESEQRILYWDFRKALDETSTCFHSSACFGQSILAADSFLNGCSVFG